MGSRRSERGQATTDYVALLAVVAALVAIAATLAAVGAPGVVNAVRAQMAHALCVVTGRACHVDRLRPCIVAMRRESRRYGLNLGFVRLDKDRFVLREQFSDGTVRLTAVKRYGAGAEGGLGATLRVKQAQRSKGFSRGVKLGAQGLLGGGTIFYARNARVADDIMRALDRGERTPVPPRQVVYEAGLRGIASLTAGGSVASLDLDAKTMRILGLRRSLRSGATTLTLTTADSASALAAAVVGGPTGSLDASAVLALRLDRRRRPIELSLRAGGTVAAGAKLSKVLAAPLALSGTDDLPANVAGRRWEFIARAKLTDPAVAAAWKRFRGSPTSLAAIRGLGQALRQRAQLDVRTYRARNSSVGTSVGLSFGLKFGAETDHTIDRFSLLAASSRPAGGVWEPRLDCVA